MFDAPSVSEVSPGYKVGITFVKDVLQNRILSCCHTLGLCSEALEQLYGPNSPSYKQRALTTVIRLLSLSMTRMLVICWSLQACEQLAQQWRRWEFNAKPVRCCVRAPVGNCTMGMKMCFSAHKMWRGEYRVQTPACIC